MALLPIRLEAFFFSGVVVGVLVNSAEGLPSGTYFAVCCEYITLPLMGTAESLGNGVGW